MNIQHLRYFIAIANSGSITAAAEVLHISQPSLSRQIRAFENELACRLLERGARSIQLTSKGEAVLREGRIMIKHINTGVVNIRKIIEDEVIYCGYAPSLGGDILKRAIGTFAQCHPKVKIILKDCSSQKMKTGVLNGSLDLCIDVADSNTNIKWTTLEKKQLTLAIPKSHPLVQQNPNRRQIKATELEEERFLLFSRYDYPSAWERMLGYFVKSGVPIKVAGEFDGIGSMCLALEAGLGIALVVENTPLSDNIKRLQLKPPPAPLCVSVGWSTKKALDHTKAAFIEELKQAVKI